MRNEWNKKLCIGSSKQASDLEITTKFIINHVQKTFDSGKDVAEALRIMNGPSIAEWRTTMSVSTSEDESTYDRENSISTTKENRPTILIVRENTKKT